MGFIWDGLFSELEFRCLRYEDEEILLQYLFTVYERLKLA